MTKPTGELAASSKIVLISEVKPYSKNAKKHTKEQIKGLARSLEKFGYSQPILVDRDYVIITGHGRFEGMKALGWTEVEVLISDMPTEDARAYRIADNKLAEGDHHEDILASEIQAIADLTPEILGDLGIDEEELTHIMTYELSEMNLDVDFDADLEASPTPTARPEDQKDLSDDLEATFQVIVLCDDEIDQEKIFAQMTEQGKLCRVQTIDVD